MQTIAAFLTLAFGTAVAFAGSIATLKVANLSVDISERQGKIDATKYLESHFETATTSYTRILIEMGNLYSAAIILENRIWEIEADTTHQNMELKNRENLGSEWKYFCDKLALVIEAIKTMMQDAFCMKTFVRSVSLHKEESWLYKIFSELLHEGMDLRKIDISLDNLSDCLAVLEIAKRRLSTDNVLETLSNNLKINYLSEQPIFNKHYDNKAVRSLFFLGNLISYNTYKLKNGQVYFCSYGTAIIKDFILSIPDGKIIKESMYDFYKNLSFAIPSIQNGFEPNQLISKSMLYAISDAERIDHLYLLVSSKEKDIENEK